MTAWMGGGLGKMDTCIFMAESLRCSPEIITTLLAAIIFTGIFTAIPQNKIKNSIKKKIKILAPQTMREHISSVLFCFVFNFILFLNLKHCISFAKHQNESTQVYMCSPS